MPCCRAEPQGHLLQPRTRLPRHACRLCGRLDQLHRVVQRCLLADHDLADHEAGVQGPVLQVLQQVGLARSEPAVDHHSLRPVTSARHRCKALQQLVEAVFDRRLQRAQRLHGVTVGHTRS